MITGPGGTTFVMNFTASQQSRLSSRRFRFIPRLDGGQAGQARCEMIERTGSGSWIGSVTGSEVVE